MKEVRYIMLGVGYPLWLISIVLMFAALYFKDNDVYVAAICLIAMFISVVTAMLLTFFAPDK